MEKMELPPTVGGFEVCIGWPASAISCSVTLRFFLNSRLVLFGSWTFLDIVVLRCPPLLEAVVSSYPTKLLSLTCCLQDFTSDTS
jgi:hypothetical protein